MLVISRKQQEFVQIGEDIIIKIIKTSRGAVKIGIAAPEECRVLRGELSEDGEPLTEVSPKLLKRFKDNAFRNAETMTPVSTFA